MCKSNTETITLEFITNAIETAYIENFIDEEYRNQLTFDIEHLSKFLCEYFDKDLNEKAKERFIEISKRSQCQINVWKIIKMSLNWITHNENDGFIEAIQNNMMVIDLYTNEKFMDIYRTIESINYLKDSIIEKWYKFSLKETDRSLAFLTNLEAVLITDYML